MSAVAGTKRRTFGATAVVLGLASVVGLSCREATGPGQPGPAAAIESVAGDQQTGQVGTELPRTLVVRVVDALGAAVPGQLVDFRVAAGGGGVSAPSAITSDSGLARVRWTLGTSATDSQQLEVRVVDAVTFTTSLSATFRARALPGPAATVTAVGGDAQTGELGVALAESLAVLVTDRYGNVVPGQSVRWAVVAGGGATSSDSTATSASGIATIVWLLGTRLDTTHLASATVGQLAPLRFVATPRLPAGATIVKTAGDGQTDTVGHALPVLPAVSVRLADGRPLSGVPVSYATTAGGGTVTGASQTTDALGVATVGAWVLGTVAHTDTLVASVVGPGNVAFTALGVAAPPAGLAIVRQPGAVSAGATMSPAVTVTVTDSYGNLVTSAGGTVALALTRPGGATLTGGAAPVTNGLAVFDRLSVDKAGTYTLTASASGLLNASSAPFVVTAGAAQRVAFIVQPSDSGLAAGATITPPVQVAVLDALGNTVTTASTDVGVAITDGTGTVGAILEGSVNVAAVHGVATFGTLSVDRAGTAYTLTAVASGLVPATSSALTVRTPVVWASVRAGGHHACGLTSAGAVYCWGSNLYGQLGVQATNVQCSVPYPTRQEPCQPRPAAVVGGLTFTSVVAGGYHTCALTPAGAAYCWGFNFYQELGVGFDVYQTYIPLAVAGGLNFASLSAGSTHTCGVTLGGTAYCWGDNQLGQVGDTTTSGSFAPYPVSVVGGLTFISVVAGASRTCGLTSTGAAYCWGQGYGSTPVAVPGGIAFANLSTGAAGSCGLTTTGAAYCWGPVTMVDYPPSVPTALPGGLSFTTVSVGGRQGCGLAPDGVAYCWGRNSTGSVGDSTAIDRVAPVPVAGGLHLASLSAGGAVGQFAFTCGLIATGVAYCWGDNVFGEVGDGTTTMRLSPVPVRPTP